MDTPILSGNKRSSLYFNKIDIYADRMEAKGIFLPKKTIKRADILSWTSVNKKLNNGLVSWTEFTIYTAKTSYMIKNLHWNNYNELVANLSEGKVRDTAKEEKIYKSFF
ncbi:hypothetical protein CHRY9390_00412 [Chryseobacterium aquaeductus]|uniref:Uncharacterized protein n=1 Tax=Chryseobacterium aquaeductus TaxID=2675056 RepID=A0A9N8MDW7_9FLAO|nr:hypothetical protein [Chryseobacterium aquaeductus]CAA7329769.1 hypothetical protein CHRY9390_00412 [Chryseobacterium potabilaquae]CAD7798953.1 hypothetical protein CHRY9390_00412 [Chryseobacterium aquaeductus]